MALIKRYGKFKLNRINIGAPFHVEQIDYGSQYSDAWKQSMAKYAQVCDRLGTVAISGKNGSVFTSLTNAKRLCALANAGRLERV